MIAFNASTIPSEVHFLPQGVIYCWDLDLGREACWSPLGSLHLSWASCFPLLFDLEIICLDSKGTSDTGIEWTSFLFSFYISMMSPAQAVSQLYPSSHLTLNRVITWYPVSFTRFCKPWLSLYFLTLFLQICSFLPWSFVFHFIHLVVHWSHLITEPDKIHELNDRWCCFAETFARLVPWLRPSLISLAFGCLVQSSDGRWLSCLLNSTFQAT